MNRRKIVITACDHARLSEMIAFGPDTPGRRAALHKLAYELTRAEIVEPEDIPVDVITINSRVALCDFETGESMHFNIVFPDEDNIAEEKISAFSPLGTDLLGLHVGDAFGWPGMKDTWRLQVTRVECQPKTSALTSA
jgi:regulator of nucleoside diphosphate kinase